MVTTGSDNLLYCCSSCGDVVILSSSTTAGSPHFCFSVDSNNTDPTYARDLPKSTRLKDNKFIKNKMKGKRKW